MNIRELHFKPLLKNPYYQTVIGSMLDLEKDFPSKTHFVTLKDRDIIALEISTPEDWSSENWSVIMLHGMGGSHKSRFMKRLSKKFHKKGFQAIRVNLRGCGSGRGLARKMYHNGSSDDINDVLKYLQYAFPQSPKILLGVSLGGHLALKAVGELCGNANQFIQFLIAVGPPIDLLTTSKLLALSENAFYARYFSRLILEDIYYLHDYFPDLPPHNLPKNVTINELDELYLAPRAKFSNVFEYYHHSSSLSLVPKITIPTKILFAKDDPIIKSTTLDHVPLPHNIEIYKTQYGGHIGFMGFNIFKEFRWMDNQLETWVYEFADTQKNVLDYKARS